MIITRIHLENFKSHQDTTIQFTTGVTTLMGANGAGKTSIFEAVSFALFKQYTSKKIEQLIHAGATKMSVELTFSVGGRTYQVRRERSKTSKASLKVLEGGKFHALVQGDTDVTKHIENLLEMDGELFLNAVYVRQGEIADLVEKTPAEKKQMVGRLLGIESLEKAWKQMRFIIEKYEDQVLKLEGKLESFEDLTQEITTKHEERTRFEDELNHVENTYQQTTIECQMAQEKKDIIDQKSADHGMVWSKIKANQKSLSQMRETKVELDYSIELINNKKKEIQEIKPLTQQLEPLKRIKEQRNELKQLRKDEEFLINEVSKINQLKQTIKDTQKDYDEHTTISKVITQLEEDRKVYEGVKSLHDANQERIKELEDDRSNSLYIIHKNLKSFNEACGCRFRTIQEFEDYLATIMPTLDKQLSKIQDEITEIKTQISNLKVKNQSLKKPIQELNEIKDSCPICKSKIPPEKQSELLNEYLHERSQNNFNIENLEKKLSKLNFTLQDLESQKSKINSIDLSIIRTHQESIERTGKEVVKIKAESEKLMESIKELEIIDAQLNESKEKEAALRDNNNTHVLARETLANIKNPLECQEQLNEIQANITVKKQSIENFTGDIDQEILKLEELKERCLLLEGSVAQEHNTLSHLKQAQKNIDEIESQLKTLLEELGKINYSLESHSRIRAEWELKNKEVNELSARKHSITGQLEQLTVSLKELHKKEESFKKVEKELKRIKDFVKLLQFIRNIYGKDGVQKALRNISRPLIEEKTRELFEKFNFEYTDIQLDSEYNISIFGPAGESNLDMISGGEKIAVALALRLAITQVLSGNNLELIMLDEPTIHLDAYRRQELIDLLKRMSILPQMIIVTHDSDLEEAADNILRIEKESGDSAVAQF